MREQKQYKVPEVTQELFNAAKDARTCLDRAIALPFTGKRAMKYASLARRRDANAWEQVYELYPELVGKAMSYLYDHCIVVMREAEET